MIKKIKDLKDFFNLKFLPLNTNYLFQLDSSKFFLFFNLELYNIQLLLKLQKKLEELNKRVNLIPIIFHKVKNYEDYLVYDLNYPTYILFDIFEIEFYKDNKKYILTNKNSTLEVSDINLNLTLKPVIFGFNKNEVFFLTEENFENNICNNLFLINNFIINEYNQKDYYILSRKNIVEFKPEGDLILVCFYNNLSSYLVFFDLDFNLKKIIEFKNDFISFDIFYLDNKEFILAIYSLLNKKLIFYKLLIENNQIQIINQKEYKLKIDDIIHVRLTKNFIILSSFNRIYFYKIIPEYMQLFNIFEDVNLFLYNVSGYNISFEKRIIDGEWRETIWGNIKDITINEDIIFVSDNQYADIRYLNINTGKSYHLKLKGLNNYENIKGKILSISFLKDYSIPILFFIDSLFKKIRFIYKDYVYSLFYDEGIYNYSKIRIYNYKLNNFIFYNTNSAIKKIKTPYLNLLTNQNFNLTDIIQKEEFSLI
jgi:hypothetical protein